MSARLSTAIDIGNAAQAILRKTKKIPDDDFDVEVDENWSEHIHIGVEPMLLALSMELALKAWFVFDHDDPKVPRIHNLVKLFDRLKPESQEKLDTEFKCSIAPMYPSFFVDNGIRNVLFQRQDAFIDWRYLHEGGKSMRFNRGEFVTTLEMVLREFRKRYRVVRYPRFPDC